MKFAGKIIKIFAQFYYVQDKENKTWECFIRRRMLKEGKSPMIGDWVEIETVSPTQGTIANILERKNQIIKPNVANLDQVIVVFSTTEPDLELYSLDRYLSFIKSALPKEKIIICINKIDLKKINITDIYKKSGFELFYVSALTKEGLDNLSKHFVNKTTVLTGPSGVGKSSLIKVFAPSENIKIGSLSAIKTGKHITRNTQLISVSVGNEKGYMVDTPGFSYIDFAGFSSYKILETFNELNNIGCSFDNCLHNNEEGCILNNPDKLKLFPASRVENYLKILQESQSRVIYKTKEESKIKVHGGKQKNETKVIPKIDRQNRAKSRKRAKQELIDLDTEPEEDI